VKTSAGVVEKVTEQEIADAKALIGRCGIGCEPASAATLAGIRARLDAVRSPQRTAERFGIEEIIDPRQTRPLLCDWVHDAYATLPASPGKPSFGTRP
jgi:Zn-dependent alcohol dehydrogenase